MWNEAFSEFRLRFISNFDWHSHLVLKTEPHGQLNVIAFLLNVWAYDSSNYEVKNLWEKITARKIEAGVIPLRLSQLLTCITWNDSSLSTTRIAQPTDCEVWWYQSPGLRLQENNFAILKLPSAASRMAKTRDRHLDLREKTRFPLSHSNIPGEPD